MKTLPLMGSSNWRELEKWARNSRDPETRMLAMHAFENGSVDAYNRLLQDYDWAHRSLPPMGGSHGK